MLDLERRGRGIHVSKTVTAKLICAFVFAYAKCWFSHDTAYTCMYVRLLSDAGHCVTLFELHHSKTRSFTCE